MEGQALLVDAGSLSACRSAHLPGAVNIPVESAVKSFDQFKHTATSGRGLTPKLPRLLCAL